MMVLRSVVVLAGFGLAGLGLGKAVAAQEPEISPPVAAPAGKSAEQWILDLGSDSYRVRLQAENELRSLGKAALPSLRLATERSDDTEVQTRARRLVRQIEGGQNPGQLQKRQQQAPVGGAQDAEPAPRGWRPGANLPDGIREQFEQLFGQMERDFGVDVPRARFFDNDFFRDLQQQVEAGGSSQGMTMQMGPDGVRVEIKQKNDKGEVESKVYEAPDLETFHQQYPGVLAKNGLGLRLGFGGAPPFQAPLGAWRLNPQSGFDASPFLRLRGLDRTQAPAQVDDPVAAPLPAEGKRLGITIRPEIAEELREHLGLDAGVGLMVESVQPGSLAESLGLARGDIVVRIGDRPIGSANDVQQALGAIEPAASVEVRYVRKGVEQTATAARPVPDNQPAGRLERRTRKSETIR